MSWFLKFLLPSAGGDAPTAADTAWHAPTVPVADDGEPETMWSEFNLNAPPRQRAYNSSRPSGSP
jgi:hypothetical protein